MDLMKTLMLYMVMVLSGASEAGGTPPPAPVPIEETAPAQAETPAPTETPAPATAQPVYRTLRNGDRGENVRALQQKLYDLGYSISKIDGVYGNNTQRAVQNFQRDHGLTVDGVAGPKTQTALYAIKTETPKEQPISVQLPVTYVTEDGETLYSGVFEMTGKEAVVSADIYKPDARYLLISDATVPVSLSQDGTPSPAAVVFTYRDTLAEKETLTVAGGKVRVDDQAYDMTWYRDAEGNAFVALKELAVMDGWEVEEDQILTKKTGTPVSYIREGDGCAVFADGEEVPGCAILQQDEIYVNAAFFEALGGTLETDGDTLILRFDAEQKA